MSILIRIIGIVFFTIAMYAVPVLCTCAFLLGWYGGVKLFLLLCMILQMGFFANAVVDSVNQEGTK